MIEQAITIQRGLDAKIQAYLETDSTTWLQIQHGNGGKKETPAAPADGHWSRIARRSYSTAMITEKEKYWSHQNLRPFSSMAPEDYIDERLNQFREWYDKKAVLAKRNCQWLRAVTAVGGPVAPVLVHLHYHQ